MHKSTRANVSSGERGVSYAVVWPGAKVLQRFRCETTKGKGDRPLLPERPAGCCAQKGSVPFSSAESSTGVAELSHRAIPIAGCVTKPPFTAFDCRAVVRLRDHQLNRFPGIGAVRRHCHTACFGSSLQPCVQELERKLRSDDKHRFAGPHGRLLRRIAHQI